MLFSASSRSTHKLTRPIWMLILEDAYFHPVHHLVLFYMRCQRPAVAIEIARRGVMELTKLGELTAPWQAALHALRRRMP